MHLTRRLLAAVGAAAVAVALATAPVSAQNGTAKVRVAHFSPDAPNVDVYVDGNKTLSGVGFGAVSDYLSVPAGEHTLEVRPAGAAPGSAPVISARPSLSADMAYTVAAVGKLAEIKGQIYTDDLSAPGEGKAKVRAIHAAPEVPAVDVAVQGGPVLFSNAAFPAATPYAEVPAGTYTLEVRRAGTEEVLLRAPGVAVKAGTIYSIAAIGGAGKPVQLKPVVDASGVATAPHGGMATGAGGTASGGESRLPALALTGAVAGMLVLAGVRSRNRATARL